MNFPKKVILSEVGPREGFQFEKRIIPTELKVELIGCLADAGLRHIQVASFVHPKLVPQMADAEKLFESLPKRENIKYSGLVLNTKGIERACLAGVECVEISISSSDTHSRKNSGMSLKEAIENGTKMVCLAQKYGMQIRASIQCAFGCAYEGEIPKERVLKMAENFLESGIDTLFLSDTTGMANPLSIKNITEDIMQIAGKTQVGLHLHDTRGLGLVNIMAAMECGVTRFDTALAGIGGCPFIPDAAGNVATEDTAYLMESMNIETGIDMHKVAKCSFFLERLFGKRFSGKIYRINI